MDSKTQEGLKEAFTYIETGNPEQARKILCSLMEYDFESRELIFTTKCCSFWIQCIHELADVENPLERGEKLLSEWKTYKTAIEQEEAPYEPALYAVQRGVFTIALENYSRLLDERDPMTRAEVYSKAGLCYKKLGQFENAKTCLTEANTVLNGQADNLAELADCYALCGEDRQAKVLFREAFFIEAKRIDLSFLDSELIRCLINKTAEKGYSGAVLQEWLPVYGILWGILNVKRELRSQEAGKLKQEIYALENEMKDPACDSAVLTPRLINMYFWLIDYYVLTKDSTQRINETLLKIKILDSSVYNLYIK